MIDAESITSSMQFEIQRLEDLNSQLDIWSDHPSAYDLTLSIKKKSTLLKGGSIDDLRSPIAIEENTDEEESILDRNDDNEEDDNEDEEEKYASELDANREAREAREKAESALSQMNTEKA